jgi:hypothetical protein
MKTPILGQAYVARSVNAADNRMVNLFPEAIPNEGKEAGFLNRAPGLSLLTTVGTGPVRGLWSFEGFMYAVSGNTLYKINSAYVATALGTIAGTGQVSMSDNGTQLFVAANGPSYIYNSNTNVFQQITDPDFPGAVTVSYLDGYFVFNEPNSQKIWVTSLLDGLSIDPLDFASAEGSPDGLIAVIVNNREAWLFGTNSIEVWYDAGTPDFPLARIQGASNEIGCAAAFSVAKLDNSIFWLGQDARGRGIVYRNNGYTGVRASNHSIEWQIQQYGDISNAIAYTYQQDGHSFYVLTFPTVQKTWVYDVVTQSWHERAGWSNGNFIRYRPNCQTAYNNEVILGDYESGNLYTYDLDVYADNGQIQKWLRSWRVIPSGQNNLRRTAQHSLQLDCETGVGLNLYPAYEAQDLATEDGLELIAEYVQKIVSTETNIELTTESNGGFALIANQPDYPVPFVPPMILSTTAYPAAVGYDPEVMLRWSDDGGHTWSNEHWASMGRIGQYGRRVFWRRLGMTMKLRDRVYEVSGTDPVKVVIVGAELLLSPTRA